MSFAEWLLESTGELAPCPPVPALDIDAVDAASHDRTVAAAPAVEISLLPSGRTLAIRAVEARDRDALHAYFQMLSPGGRRNRFTGASNGPSMRELELLCRSSEGGRVTLVAVMILDGAETIVGEARCLLDRATGGFEFGLSVRDDIRSQGVGSAILSYLERCAASLGANQIFGDTFRTNNEMQALARKAGFSFANTPGDWCERRMFKPCTSSLRAAAAPARDSRRVNRGIADHPKPDRMAA
jgi:GNAT superfamily N-acetyltransferase